VSTNYDPNAPQSGSSWATPSYGDPSANMQHGGGVPPGGMNYAVWADRVLAALIDGGLVLATMIVIWIVILIVLAIFGAIGAGLSQAGGEEAGAFSILAGWGFCCVAFCMIPVASIGIGFYNKVFLVGKRGFSIGQGVMKLRVVTAQNTLVPTGTLVLRLFVQAGFGLIPFLPLLSILWPLWDPQRQALHDKAVGTFVIKAG
jgi:uncharacterized RDD family membrane protein YckC